MREQSKPSTAKCDRSLYILFLLAEPKYVSCVRLSEVMQDISHDSVNRFGKLIRCWHSFWYVTDGWKVYPMYIEPEDHLVSKTYMTRIEGENTRLRHYLARLHRKTLCYSNITSAYYYII